MPLFTSPREKRLWLYALIGLIAIFSTLALGRPLQEMLSNQIIQTAFFLTGMILIGITITLHGLKVRPSKTEMAIWFGLAAIYVLFIFRLGAPERSHLIEYSVLAILIHMALIERTRQKNQIIKPGWLALVLAIVIGVTDECIQIFLPDRVFSRQDMMFNGLAALMAIGATMILKWTRKKFRKNN